METVTVFEKEMGNKYLLQFRFTQWISDPQCVIANYCDGYRKCHILAFCEKTL